MEINADFSKRVAVHAARLPWIPSPIKCIDRRMQLRHLGTLILFLTSTFQRLAASALNFLLKLLRASNQL